MVFSAALGSSFHLQEHIRKNVRKNVRWVPPVSAQSGFAVRVPGKMLVVEYSRPALLGLCYLYPLQMELSLNTSRNSGLYCYVQHPKSFIFNPDVPLDYCILAFERFHSFHQTCTKILLKVPLIVKAIGASSLLPRCSSELFYMDQGRCPITS